MSAAGKSTVPKHQLPAFQVGLGLLERQVLYVVAIHEAGHAVAALANGRRFDEVTIRPVQGISSGHCTLDFSLLNQPVKGTRVNPWLITGLGPKQLNRPTPLMGYRKEDIRKLVVCVLAGDAAEIFFHGRILRDEGPLADGEDERLAERYVKMIAGGAGQWPVHRAMEALRKRAARFVAQEWEAIHEVARALFERETLTYDVAKAITHPLLQKH